HVSGGGLAADRRRTPQGGGGVENLHGQSLPQNDTAAEEPDTGRDVGGDLQRRGGGADLFTEQHEGRSSCRDEGLGTQTRSAGTVLAFQADQRAAPRGQQHPRQELEVG